MTRAGKHRKLRLALLVSAAVLSCPALSRAQIDPNNGATVDQSFNNKPDVLNIVSPNGSGLSHNTFDNFNVSTQGLVINNSSVATSSQLAGAVVGNDNLANGQATIILNEVTSGNQSSLNGFQELVGGSAEYILANPNGITCNGCGFINFPRATVTTGTPVVAGGTVTGLDVTQGQITITGNGVDARSADMFDLVARNIVIDGQVNADGEVGVIAGRNDVDYSTRNAVAKAPAGGAPALAIDSTALGGIYAGRVKLVATEAGTGVRIRGDMAATTDDITLDASGNISFSGNDVSAQRDITVNTTGNTDLDGTTAFAGRDTSVTGVANTVQNSSSIGATQDVSISGTALTTTGGSNEIFSDRDVTLNLTGQISAANVQIEAADDLDIDGNDIEFFSNTDVVAADDGSGSLTINDAGGNINIDNSSLIYSGTTLNITSTGGSITNAGLASADHGIRSFSAMTLNAASLANTGDIQAGTTLNTTLTGAYTGSGTLKSTNDLTMDVGSITQSGQISSGNNLDITADSLISNQAGGLINAANNLTATTTDAGSDIFNDGTLFAGNDLTLQFEDEFLNNGASALVFARNNILIGASNAGAIASQIINNDLGRIESFGGDITLNADIIRNRRFAGGDPQAQIIAAGDINANFASLFLNESSYVSAAGDINFDGQTTGDLTNDNTYGASVIEAAGDINQNNINTLTNNGTIDDTTGAGPGNQADPDITLTTVSLPTDSNGLFVTSQDPNANYLIETNPAFNLNALFSSDYLLTRIGLDPEEFRRLGDNFWEQQYIRDQLTAAFGQRFILENVENEDEQYRILMENAGDVAEDLDLTIGVALTAEQIANLSKDIVWLVTQVVDGQEVLVPQVFLTDATKARLQKAPNGDAVFVANNINANNVNRLQNNAGTMLAWNNMDVNTGEFYNVAGLMEAGNNLNINTTGDLINLGGTIRSGNQVALNAGGEFRSEALTQTTVTNTWGMRQGELNGSLGGLFSGSGSFWTVTENSQETISSSALIEGAQGVIIKGGEAVILKGSDLRSGGDASIESGGRVDIVKLDLQNRSVERGLFGGNRKENIDISSVGSNVDVANNLTITAQDDINVDGSDVQAGNNVVLRAEEGGINNTDGSRIEAGNNLIGVAKKDIRNINSSITAGTNFRQEERPDVAVFYAPGEEPPPPRVPDANEGRLALVSEEGSITNEAEELNDKASIMAAGDAALIAKNDIDNIGGNIGSGGDVIIASEEGSVTNETKVFRLGDTRNYRDVAGPTGTIAGGGDVTIVAKENIDNKAADILSGGDMTLVAREGDVNIEDKTLEQKKTWTTTKKKTSGWWIFKKTKTTKKTHTEITQDSKKSVLSSGGSLNIFSGEDTNITASDLLAENDMTIYAKDGSINIGASVNTDTYSENTTVSNELDPWAMYSSRAGLIAGGIIGSENSSSSYNSTTQNVVGSSLSAGGNVSLYAGENIDFTASNLNAGSNIFMDADGNINIGAILGENTSDSTYEENGWTAGANFTGYQTASGSSNSTDQTVYGSSLNAGNNIILNAGNDLGITSGDLSAGNNIGLSAGNDINIAALIEREEVDSEDSVNQYGGFGGTNGASAFGSIGGAGSNETNDFQDESVVGSSLNAAGTLSMDAGRDVNSTASELSGDEGISISAERDINLLALAENDEFDHEGSSHGGGFGVNLNLNKSTLGTEYSGDESNVDYDGTFYTGNSLKSDNGNIVLNAGRDVTEQSSDVSAGGDIAVIAGRDFTSEAMVDSVTLESSSVNRNSNLGLGLKLGAEETMQGIVGMFDQQAANNMNTGPESPLMNTPTLMAGLNADYTQTQTYDNWEMDTAQTSNWTSGNNITISAGRDAILTGTTFDAGNNIALSAGRNMELLAAQNTFSHDTGFETFGGEVLGSKLGVHASGGYVGDFTTEDATTNSVVSLNAGGNIMLNAGNDMTLEGTEANADGNIGAFAGNNMDVLAVYDTYDRTHDTLRIKGSAEAKKGKSFFDTSGGGHTDSKFGNISGHFTFEDDDESARTARASSFGAGGNVTLSAGNDMTLEGTNIDAGGDASLRAGNDLNFEAVENTYTRNRTFVDVKAKKGKREKIGKGLGYTGAKYGQGMSVDIQTENTDMTLREGGSINAGGNLTLSAGNDMTLEGTQGTAGGDMSLEAGNNLTMKAAKSTVKSDAANVYAGVGAVSTGFNVDELHYDATMYDGSNFSAAGNMNVKTGGDLNLEGSQLNAAGTGQVDVGGNLNVETLVSEETYRGGTLGLGYSLSGSSAGSENAVGTGQYNSVGNGNAWANADDELSYSGQYETLEMAGIQSVGDLNVNVDGKTSLKGGYIDSVNGTESLSTQSLSTENVTARSEHGSFTNWGNWQESTASGGVGDVSVSTLGQGNLLGFGEANDGINKVREIRNRMDSKVNKANSARTDLINSSGTTIDTFREDMAEDMASRIDQFTNVKVASTNKNELQANSSGGDAVPPSAEEMQNFMQQLKVDAEKQRQDALNMIDGVEEAPTQPSIQPQAQSNEPQQQEQVKQQAAENIASQQIQLTELQRSRVQFVIDSYKNSDIPSAVKWSLANMAGYGLPADASDEEIDAAFKTLADKAYLR